MDVKSIVFFIASLVSFVIFLAAGIYYHNHYRKISSSNKSLSFTLFFTLVTFFSVLILFFPVCYYTYNFGSRLEFFRILFLDINSSFRVFILDGDFSTVLDAIEKTNKPVYFLTSSLAAILHVIAPILTLGTVLSLFKRYFPELKFRFKKSRDTYILSELNECSIILAKSIMEKKSKEITEKNKGKAFWEKEKMPLIVFTDVFIQNEEDDYELVMEARNLDALCLKKDITHIDILSRKGSVEIFLIGSDESENISQAADITKKLEKSVKVEITEVKENVKEVKKVSAPKQDVKIFVFSVIEGSGIVIDSLRYDNLLAAAAEKNFGYPEKDDKKDDKKDDTFKIRRVDYVRQLVWKTVADMDVLKKSKDKVISVMIAGMGLHGMEFFRTLIWFCQAEGYRVEFNLFDKAHSINPQSNFVESKIGRMCPELAKNKSVHVDGDANYDIRCYDGIDFTTDAFAKIIEESDDAERLKKTDIVIVCLGDDDANIETAVYLRSLFDRINKFKLGKNSTENDEHPHIYSVVYDGDKSGVIHGDDNEFLMNHKREPYHINFIGSIEQQYSYENVYDSELEQEAFSVHVGWADVNKRAAEEMRAQGISEAEIDTAGFSYYTIDEKEEHKKYEKFEYFRLSSISKVMHKKMLKESEFKDKIECLDKAEDGTVKQLCSCENCTRRKKMEHNRWNAYMRAQGFNYPGVHDGGLRADRAMLHNDLCNWNELTEWERAKD